MNAPKSILVTGCAGFIGFHVSRALLERGESVIGLDNLNEYYDVNLKKRRLELLKEYSQFQFVFSSLEDKNKIDGLFYNEQISEVIHLAAQAGVRYSLTNPKAYIDSNLVGFFNILEACKSHHVNHLIYASSSSVYGLNKEQPFSVEHKVDQPISLYAATKKANELMAHTYSHLYRLPTTGLRFFTVYGPWGRPDMALFSFTKNILEGRPIQVFNSGKMKRDFTYIDDITESILKLRKHIPCEPEQRVPYKIHNIGNQSPVALMDFIRIIEHNLNKKAIIDYQPLQAGDVLETYADISDLVNEIGFKPKTSVEDGIKRFLEWYQNDYMSL